MKILAFFAHPDDETMLAGGTLALLAKHGAQVHYLCATRGEGGETGEPPLCTQDKLGKLREKELTCAVQALGGHSLNFLGYVDPLVEENDELGAYTSDLSFLANQVVTIIRHMRPDALISHGSSGEYGHPGHVLTFKATQEAVRLLGNAAPEFYTVQADFPDHPKPRLSNKNDPAHIIIDVASVLEDKTRAALCHRTQHALFIRRTSETLGRMVTVPEVITQVESLHRIHPPYNQSVENHNPPDPLFEFLLATGAAWHA
jgi:LmbE family N-acetylglucosaminyl deacetylase